MIELLIYMRLLQERFIKPTNEAVILIYLPRESIWAKYALTKIVGDLGNRPN